MAAPDSKAGKGLWGNVGGGGLVFSHLPLNILRLWKINHREAGLQQGGAQRVCREGGASSSVPWLYSKDQES